MNIHQPPFNTRYLAGGVPVQLVFSGATVADFSSPSSQKAIQEAVLQSIQPLYGQATPYVNITGVTSISGGSLNADGTRSSIQVNYILEIQAKSYNVLVIYAQNISSTLEANVANGRFNAYFTKDCPVSSCAMSGATSSSVTVSPLVVYYIPKGMSVSIPSVQPTSLTGSSQSGSSASGGSSSITTYAAAGAGIAIVCISLGIFFYVYNIRRRAKVSEEFEEDFDYEIQKIHKPHRKEVEMVDSPMPRGRPEGKKKKKKRVVDEDASLEQYYNNVVDVDEIKMRFSLPAYSSNRFAPNKQQSINTFGVFELQKGNSIKATNSIQSQNINPKSGKKKRIPKQYTDGTSDSGQSASSKSSSQKGSEARVMKLYNPMLAKSMKRTSSQSNRSAGKHKGSDSDYDSDGKSSRYSSSGKLNSRQGPKQKIRPGPRLEYEPDSDLESDDDDEDVHYLSKKV